MCTKGVTMWNKRTALQDGWYVKPLLTIILLLHTVSEGDPVKERFHSGKTCE
jgi:hypothetical protein